MTKHQKNNPPYTLSPRKNPQKLSRSKNINKLIFDIDDGDVDEISESQQSNKGSTMNLRSGLSKMQRLKNIKSDSNSKIMPSFMGGHVEDNFMIDQYEGKNYGGNVKVLRYQPQKQKQKQKQKEKQKYKIVHTEGLKNRKLFNFDDDEQQSRKQKQEQVDIDIDVDDMTQNKSELINQSNIHNSNPQTSSVNNCKKYKFFSNDQSIQNSSIIAKSELQASQKQIPQNSSQHPRSREQLSLVFDLGSDSQSNEENNQHHITNQNNNQLTSCGQEKTMQIINTDPHSDQISRELAIKLGQLEDPHNKRIFLTTPIPEGVYFNFQVHKSKNFMKTQYLFWLEHGDQMSLFASAANNKTYIDRTVFTVNIGIVGKYKNLQQESLFLGQFVSDFKREVFTLYDHKNYQKPQEKDNVLCTVASVINYIDPKMKSQQLYIPKVVNNKCTTITHNTLSKNLKKLYKISKFYDNLQKYSTYTVPPKVIDKMREEFKVVTNTSRNSLVKDEQHCVRLLFLKMQQNRFKIRAGPGLTPLQVFSYAIVHLE